MKRSIMKGGEVIVEIEDTEVFCSETLAELSNGKGEEYVE